MALCSPTCSEARLAKVKRRPECKMKGSLCSANVPTSSPVLAAVVALQIFVGNEITGRRFPTRTSANFSGSQDTLGCATGTLADLPLATGGLRCPRSGGRFLNRLINERKLL